MNSNNKKQNTPITWKSWMFRPLSSVCILLDKTVFAVKPEEQIIEEQLSAALREAEQAARSIRDHMFTQHMARARIQALENWNHGANLLCDHMNNPSPQG